MVRTTDPRGSTDDGSPADGRFDRQTTDGRRGCPHPATAYDLLGIDAGNAYHRCRRCDAVVIVPLGGGDGDGV